ncbi:MAG: GNAT family N-acetyltransferase [Ferruginibacter sp.]
MKIQEALNQEDLINCYEVMKELRPHHTLESFLGIMDQMKAEGYRLIYLEDNDKAVCVAGFRLTTTLYDGLIIDFDDFVTVTDVRGKGYAAQLFDHLVDIAKESSIKTIHLNSNHQRFDAHRFYLNKKMKIVAHHFRIEV